MDLHQGDHICSIYSTVDELFSSLIPYFKVGLTKNEKCVYVLSNSSKTKVISEFKKRGLDVEKLIKLKKFEFLHAKEIYFFDDEFDSEKVINTIEEYIDTSISENFKGVRGASEMDWALKCLANKKKLSKYESKLNELFPQMKIISICLYDENKCDKNFLTEVIHTHKYIFFNGKLYQNKYYYNPKILSESGGKLFPSGSYEFLKEDIIDDK